MHLQIALSVWRSFVVRKVLSTWLVIWNWLKFFFFFFLLPTMLHFFLKKENVLKKWVNSDVEWSSLHMPITFCWSCFFYSLGCWFICKVNFLLFRRMGWVLQWHPHFSIQTITLFMYLVTFLFAIYIIRIILSLREEGINISLLASTIHNVCLWY